MGALGPVFVVNRGWYLMLWLWSCGAKQDAFDVPH